tara:strand:+ start:824 stop:1747 length:924 start_codon:yes stop_codon:yes gene_type:complete
MSSPTFSPDGKWMWNGNEWIPAPPKSEILPVSSIDQTFVSNVAHQNDIEVEQLSGTARYFDQNKDGFLQQVELEMAARSIVQEPTVAAPTYSTQFQQNEQTTITQATKYLVVSNEKTFYAPLITIGIVLVLMLTPFFTFNHDELTNSEEREACEELYQIFQSASNNEGTVESDDIDCPMNGYSSALYAVETISNFDTESLDEDSSGESSEDLDDEVEFFGWAMLMLFFSPFVYLGLTVFALVSILILKMQPYIVGFIQLFFVISFLIVSLLGVVEITDDFSLSAHGNFAGIGFYLVGFVSMGYFVRK